MQSLAGDHPDDKQTQLDLADRHLSLGLVLIDAGDFKQALVSILAATEIQQKLLERFPQDREVLRDMGAITPRSATLMRTPAITRRHSNTAGSRLRQRRNFSGRNH